MRPLHPLLPLIAILLLHAPVTTAQEAGWFSDLQSARELAAQRGVTLLIHVYGQQCPPCLRMERDVFADPRIQSALTRGIVAVKLNGDANPTLTRELGVRSYPADVVLRPGLPTAVLHRPHSTAEYLALLDSIAVNPPAHTTKPAPPKLPRTDSRGTRAHSGSKRRSQIQAPEPRANANMAPRKYPADGDALNTSLVGLDGFCPVTLQQRRILSPGRPELTAVHEGVRYQFASAELRSLFNAEPGRYAPVVQGCDPVTLAREHRAVPGSVRYGAWYAGRLYLFQSDANRQTFKASPVTWTKIQSAAAPSARVRR